MSKNTYYIECQGNFGRFRIADSDIDDEYLLVLSEPGAVNDPLVLRMNKREITILLGAMEIISAKEKKDE
jgi:hypothetical protein